MLPPFEANAGSAYASQQQDSCQKRTDTGASCAVRGGAGTRGPSFRGTWRVTAHTLGPPGSSMSASGR